MINWTKLTTDQQLKEAIQLSFETKVLIFKHSTRCGVSSRALQRLESEWDRENINVTAYLLDLIKYRDLSNKIAKVFSVPHQSPQVLLIENGECIYDDSHNMISTEEIKKLAA